MTFIKAVRKVLTHAGAAPPRLHGHLCARNRHGQKAQRPTIPLLKIMQLPENLYPEIPETRRTNNTEPPEKRREGYLSIVDYRLTEICRRKPEKMGRGAMQEDTQQGKKRGTGH